MVTTSKILDEEYRSCTARAARTAARAAEIENWDNDSFDPGTGSLYRWDKKENS